MCSVKETPAALAESLTYQPPKFGFTTVTAGMELKPSTPPTNHGSGKCGPGI